MSRVKAIGGSAAMLLGVLAGCAEAQEAAPPAATATAAAPAAPAADTRPADQRLYARYCLTCHQADGGGVPNLQPPIKGGTWVTGDARALALFVLTGGFDSASRKDGGEGNVMPPFAQISDAELAEILTYIREKFGNGAPAVTAAEVAQARATIPPK